MERRMINRERMGELPVWQLRLEGWKGLDPIKTTEKKSWPLPTLFSQRDKAKKFRIRVHNTVHNVRSHYLTLEHILYKGTVHDIGQDICSSTDHVVAEVSGVARHILK
jgi:hypothetical protein